MISPSVVFKRKTKTVHLLQISEIEFFENEKSDLHKLRQIFPIINLPELYFDIFKMNILLLWGEILNLILKNEGKNEELFDYLTHSIEYLNSTHNVIGNFNLYFLYRLAGFIGFRINTSSWQENYVFNINDGSFYPSDPATPYISGPNTAKIIYQLCTCPLAEIKAIPLNRQSRNILLDVILLFYSIHLNINFNIKSIQVIREVFAWTFPIFPQQSIEKYPSSIIFGQIKKRNKLWSWEIVLKFRVLLKKMLFPRLIGKNILNIL